MPKKMLSRTVKEGAFFSTQSNLYSSFLSHEFNVQLVSHHCTQYSEYIV